MKSRWTKVVVVLTMAAGLMSTSQAQQPQVRALTRDPHQAGPTMLSQEAITPMFPSGTPSQVGARLSAGDGPQCQVELQEWIEANPDHPDLIYARFLLGVLAHHNGDHQTAESVLSAVAPMVAVLADHAYYFAAQSALALNHLEQSVRLARLVSERSVFRPRSTFLEAQALRQLGLPLQAVPLLETFLERYPNAYYLAQVELELAETRVELEDYQGAAQLFHRVSNRYPGSSEEQTASQRLEAILQHLPEESREGFSRFTDEEILTRADALFQRHRSQQVIDLLCDDLDRLGAGTPAGCQAAFLIGKSYSKLRRHTEAIPFYQRIVDSGCADQDLVVKSLYNLGRALWNVDRDEEAIQAFRRLYSEHAQHTYADDAMLYEARIERQRGNRTRFLQLLEQQVHRFPTGDMLADAHWLLFEDAFSANGYQDAISFADAIALRTGEDSLYNRGRIAYFRARALQLSGDDRAAQQGYETVIREVPLSYYALLAFNRLATLAPQRTEELLADLHEQPQTEPPAAVPVQPPQILQEPAFQRGLMLLRLGLLDLAQRQFDQLLQENPNQDGLLWVVTFLYDRAHAYHISHNIPRRLIRSFLTRYPDADTREQWHLAYPLPFQQQIEEAAQPRQLDPFLVYAIMREESGFNPRAESWANARGLMQLMLPTARSMAERLDMRRPREADLFRPATSIALGAEYLSLLSSRYGGHPALTIAGYNGGEGNVDRWLSERGQLDLDRFVEEIPYQQTRDYTKRVLMTYWIYRWLYGDPPIVELPFSLPRS
ncbi:MAG: transglycosylase SLT domain-containing protein [Bradymonadales bacterium]|nr:transglycosylase SLT domain-containing protein [Bradymonadales bacterium]